MKRFLACLTLLVFCTQQAHAAVQNYTFDSTSGLTYSTSEYAVTSSLARLQKTPIIHNDNSNSEFGGGTGTEVSWNGTSNQLELTAGQSSGSFESQVIDSLENTHTWNAFSWVPYQAYKKPYVNNKGVETGYTANIGTAQNRLLMHFDHIAGSTSFVDSSNSGNTATCTTDCPSTNETGFYGKSVSFDGTQGVSINDPGTSNLDLADWKFLDMLYKPVTEDFAYRREISLSAATTTTEIPVKVTLTPGTFDYSKVQADGDDIRFFQATGEMLPYWIQEWDTNGTSTIWVKVIKQNTSSFTMVYGNNTVEGLSRGRDVFLYFDDFQRQGVNRFQSTFTEGGANGWPSSNSFFVDNALMLFNRGSVLQPHTYAQPQMRLTPNVEVETTVTLKEDFSTAANAPKFIIQLRQGDSQHQSFYWYAQGNPNNYDYGIQLNASSNYPVNVGKSMPLNKPHTLRLRQQRISDGNDTFRVTVDPVVEGDGVSIDHTLTGTLASPDLYYLRFGQVHYAEVWMGTTFMRKIDTAERTTALGAESAATKALPYDDLWPFENLVTLSAPTQENNMLLELKIADNQLMRRAQHNGEDLRFFDEAGNEVPYFIEHWTPGATASLIWLKIPNAGTSTLRLRYGNPFALAKSTPSIFEFYDNFDHVDGDGNDAIDTSKWTVSGDTEFLKFWAKQLHYITTGSGQNVRLSSVADFSGQKAIRIRVRPGFAANSINQQYFCFAYGALDGAMTTFGYGEQNGRISSMETNGIGAVCPHRTNNHAELTFSTAITAAAASSYNFDEFKMSSTGGLSRTLQTSSYDGLTPTTQSTTDFMGVTSGKIHIAIGNREHLLDHIIVRPYFDNEPTLTLQSNERFAGIGKVNSYGLSFVRGKMITFDNVMTFLNGGYLAEGWNHLLIQSDHSNNIPGWSNQAMQRVHINGQQVGFMPTSTSTNNNLPFVIGGSPAMEERITGELDEFQVHWGGVYNALAHYSRHFGNVRMQLRICDDALCDGETYRGPDGTANTWWDETSNTALTPPSFVLAGMPTSRYIQYKVDYTADRPNVQPALKTLTLGQGLSLITKPLMTITTPSIYARTIQSISAAAGPLNMSVFRFQFAMYYNTAPAGFRWFYWNGSTWTPASTTFNIAETNTIEEIATNIRYLPAQRTAGNTDANLMRTRFAIDSTAGEPGELDTISITYFNTSNAPTAPTALYANNSSTGAQSGLASPALLSETEPVFSAIFNDADTADTAKKYILQVSSAADFSSFVYDSQTVTSGGITFPTPVHAGERSPDLVIPTGLLSYDTPYYWRLAFIDAWGNTSPYATAQFSIQDNAAPSVTISPADAATDVSRHTDITVTVTDAQLGVDTSSMQITVGGVSALEGTTCQAGFACTITAVANGHQIVLNPDASFGYNATVPVAVEVSDGVNVANVAASFTTIPNGAPEAPSLLYANTTALGAQTGEINPTRLVTTNIAVSALHNDDDEDDAALAYEVQVASANTFAAEEIVYTTATATPGGVLLGAALQDASRMPDVQIPGAGLALETTYFWRLRFKDSFGNWGAYSPSGAGAASFSLADTAAPVLSASTPAANATDVARNAPVTFTLSDTGSVPDQDSLDVTIGGEAALVDGVCQTGFTCQLTLNGNDLEVEVSRDTAYASSSVISVAVAIDDHAGVPNTLQTSWNFTTAPTAPLAPTGLQAETEANGAQAGRSNPADLENLQVVVSALYHDDDAGDTATAYAIDIATDNTFATIVDTVSGTFDTPVALNGRTPDIALNAAQLTYNTPYYWRIRFTDSQSLAGTYSASGNDAATFTIPDTEPPVFNSGASGPVQGATNVAPTSSISLRFDDNSSGTILSNTLSVTVAGDAAIDAGTCQAGFTCSITPDASGTTALISRDLPFNEGQQVLVEYTVSDGVQNITGTLTFTVLITPVTQSAPVFMGSGGGAASAPTAPTSSDVSSTTTTNTGTSTAVVPPTTSDSSFVSPVLQLIPRVPIIFEDIMANPEILTSFGADLQELLTAPVEGETTGSGLMRILSSNFGGSSSSSDAGTSGSSGDGLRGSAPVVTWDNTSPTEAFLDPPTNPPRHRGLSFEESLCPELNLAHNYTIPADTDATTRAQILRLKELGVDFSNGGRDLALASPITRSELLRYLLQAHCRIFDTDFSQVLRFPDVFESHLDFRYIMLARKYAYVSGYLHDGHYRPDRYVSRAEALKIILEVVTQGRVKKVSTSQSPFRDVQLSDWFIAYVYAGARTGVVDLSNDYFRPADELTLHEIIKLMSRSTVFMEGALTQ